MKDASQQPEAGAPEWKPLRMDAYYFGFGGTDVEHVDRLLSAVACAGKAFHHTESWGEEIGHTYHPSHRGDSPVAWIQNAAIDAAKVQTELVTALQAMVDNFRPFKMKPIGGEGSAARMEQDAQIKAHADAVAALAAAKGGAA